MAKVHVVREEVYPKGSMIAVETLLQILNDPVGCTVEVRSTGKRSDTSEFMVVKILTNPLR